MLTLSNTNPKHNYKLNSYHNPKLTLSCPNLICYPNYYDYPYPKPNPKLKPNSYPNPKIDPEPYSKPNTKPYPKLNLYLNPYLYPFH
jgi:hypothetical protein